MISEEYCYIFNWSCSK